MRLPERTCQLHSMILKFEILNNLAVLCRNGVCIPNVHQPTKHHSLSVLCLTNDLYKPKGKMNDNASSSWTSYIIDGLDNRIWCLMTLCCLQISSDRTVFSHENTIANNSLRQCLRSCICINMSSHVLSPSTMQQSISSTIIWLLHLTTS